MGIMSWDLDGGFSTMSEHVRDDDPRQWKHVDHDLCLLIELHREINNPHQPHPKTVQKAMYVAYAAAFRSVMEFAHSHRPRKGADKRDITSKGLLGESLETDWTLERKARMVDADKLVAHLTKARIEREGHVRDWGDPEDLALWEGVVERLVDGYAEQLPDAAAAWRRKDGSDASGRSAETEG